ncbi:MAG: hypothetical protein RRX93_07500 [Bacteroidales bacterium]
MENKIYSLDDIDNSKFYGGEKYSTHKVFELLNDLYDFYDFLQINNSSSAKAAFCVKDMGDIDKVMFGSITGTITSIKTLLNIGSINDAFAIVRKYEDAVITNIYVDLLLDKEHLKNMDCLMGDKEFVLGSLCDNQINKWVYDEKKLGEQNEFGIAGFENVKELNGIFNLGVKTQKNSVSELAKFTLRQFCNNNVHYNALKYFLYNDKDISDMNDTRVKLLNKIHQAMSNIFIVHFSYMFVINPEYYNSSDYLDHLDCGQTPPDGSQNWVAPIVQSLYDKYIKQKEDLCNYLKGCNWLEIE